jgi:MtaA/CmuA family methyltransferase
MPIPEEGFMKCSERVDRRLAGQEVDRPPNFDIMMAFAVHYIGRPLSRFYLDYKVLAEANLAVQQAFELDLVQTISDPYREAADLGLEVEFPDDGLPLRKAPLLAQPSDLKKLKPVDPAAGRRMSDRIEAVRCLHERVGSEVPVLGWVEGALAVTNVLRGDTALMLDLYDRPEWVRECLEIMVEVEIAFTRAQIEAGADIIGLGDAIASQISPAMYEEFALPYEQRIFKAVHDMGAIARLHICGNTSRILRLMSQSGADIIDLDWMVDLRTAAAAYGDSGPALCGNFDPVRVMLRGTPEQVHEAIVTCVAHAGKRGINAAGCEIPDGTPHENLFAQARALREL